MASCSFGKNSDLSKARLGYEETVRELARMFIRAHPKARPLIQERIDLANHQKGETVFDWLINAIGRENPEIELILG